MIRRGPIILLFYAACAERIPRRAPTMTPTGASATLAPEDTARAEAMDLGACLTSCRVRSQGASFECRVQGKAEEECLAIAKQEGVCREDCLTRYRTGLECASCMEHLQRYECVYGDPEVRLKCRWQFPDRTFTLGYCLARVAKDPPREMEGGSPCPSNDECGMP